MTKQTKSTNEVMTESERHSTISLEADLLSKEIRDRLYDLIDAQIEDEYVDLVLKARKSLDELSEFSMTKAYWASRREEKR
jgi:adenosine deaminase